MTKACLITLMADRLRLPWARAELLVDAVFGSMEQSIRRGEKIEIRAARPNYPYTQNGSVGGNWEGGWSGQGRRSQRAAW